MPGMSDHLVSEALYLTDPDGLGIEVYADRPALDLAASRPAAGDDDGAARRREVVARGSQRERRTALPWTGMPAGTVIGHVHLYVGGPRPRRRVLP